MSKDTTYRTRITLSDPSGILKDHVIELYDLNAHSESVSMTALGRVVTAIEYQEVKPCQEPPQ